MALFFELPWDSQPQEVVSPAGGGLASGLLRLWNFAGLEHDSVAGAPPTSSISTSFVPGPAGVGREISATKYTLWDDDYRAQITNKLTWFYYGRLPTFQNGVLLGNAQPGGVGYNSMLYGGASGQAVLFLKTAGSGSSVNHHLDSRVLGDVAIVGTYDGATMRIYVNGVESTTSTAKTGNVDTTDFDTTLNRWNATSAQGGLAYLGGVSNRVWSASEAGEFYKNPWQLFAPQQIWVPVSAGGPVTHATTGALAASGATIAGSAAHIAKHATTGALAGSGAAVVGSSARTRAHPTSGALQGDGATIAGSADHVVPGGTHDTSGALQGDGAAVVGSAAHIAIHGTSGVLAGSGATLAGSAARVAGAVTHATTGALGGGGAVVTGSARGPQPDAETVELLGGGPGKPRKRRELEKDSYLYRLLSPPVAEIEVPAEVKPEAVEAIAKVAEKVVAKQAKPRPSDVAASLKKLGIDYKGAYRDAYQEVYTELLKQHRAFEQQQDEDEQIVRALAAIL